MSTGDSMRLGSFPALRATSFSDLAELLASKGLRAERAGPGDRARVNAAYRPGWYLAHMDYEMPLRISAPAGRDDYTLYLPVVGAVAAINDRHRAECARGRTVMASPQRPLTTLTGPNASRINLTVRRDTIMRHWAVLTGDAPMRPPEFALTLDTTQPEVRAYLRYLWGILDALDEDPQFLDRPLVGNAVEQTLVSGLLSAFPHDFSDRLAPNGPGPASADVRRVVDFIHAHAGDEVTLAELAGIARVPARTLQTHFQSRFGCGPIQYLRQQRLQAARRELLRGDPGASVTDIALRWGFGSLGRFAGHYRAYFGETPSQTLLRHRRG